MTIPNVFRPARYSVSINTERNKNIDAFGLKTLHDRYLVRPNGTGEAPETDPQQMFARVAGYYADDAAHAQRLYDYMSNHWFMPSTPILANGGTNRALPISCFLMDVDDSRRGLGNHYNENLWLASEGGGVSANWSKVRHLGSVTSRGNRIDGIVPHLTVMDKATAASNQGDTRKSSYAAYLDISHPEIEEFINLRKAQGGDAQRKCLSVGFHHAVNIPDAFMQLVMRRSEDANFDDRWPLLHPRTGEVVKYVSASALWIELLKTRVATGEPFLHFIDTSNRFLPQWLKEKGLRVNSSNLCLAGDQKLLTAQGFRTMRELWEAGGCQELNEEVAVLAATVEDQERGTYRPSIERFGRLDVVNHNGLVAATNVYRTGQLVPVYKVTLHSGHTIRATSNHKFVVAGRSDGVPLRDLKVGMQLQLTQVSAITGTYHDPDYALLAGWVIGDGSVSTLKDSGQQRAHIRVFHRDIEEGVCEKLGVSLLALNRHNQSLGGSQAEARWNHKEIRGFGFQRADLQSLILGRMLREDNIVPGHKHAVPQRIWQGDRATVAAFLRGLFSADGSVQYFPQSKAVSIRIGQAHRDLLAQVQLLLQQFGISSRIRSMRGAGQHEMNDGCGGKKSYDRKAMYELMITGRPNYLAFRNCIGFLQPYKNDKLARACQDLRGSGNSESAVKAASEIISIEYDGDEDVYCLTEPGDNRIEVQGVSTFNCTEITLPNNYERTAICCLGSFNAAREKEYHGNFQMVYDIMAMMDNVLTDYIDNAPPDHWRSVNAARSERSIGLGVMGFHTRLQQDGIPFESALATSVNLSIFKWLAEARHEANLRLARERGECSDAQGYGVRFSHTGAIAPNASISIVCGNISPSCDVINSNAYLQKTLSGTNIRVVPELERCLDKYGLNTPEVWKQIKADEGSVQNVKGLNELEREVFKTSWEIDQRWVVDHAAARQPYIDQAQSVNLYMEPTVDVHTLHHVHMRAWVKGLKTLYYLRSDHASKVGGKTFAVPRQQLQDYGGCLACEG